MPAAPWENSAAGYSHGAAGSSAPREVLGSQDCVSEQAVHEGIDARPSRLREVASKTHPVVREIVIDPQRRIETVACRHAQRLRMQKSIAERQADVDRVDRKSVVASGELERRS